MSLGFPFTFLPSSNIFSALYRATAPNQFPKGLFCIFERKASACIYPEKSGFKMHVLLYAHLVTTRWFEAKALFL